MPQDMKLVEMGRLGKALGLKGELYLVWHGENLPEKGQILYIPRSEDHIAELVVSALRVHKERLVLSLAGIDNRNLAEELAGSTVFQTRSQLRKPDEEEAFLADLIDSEIFLTDGTCIGKLDHVEFPAGQQIWVIKGCAGNEILFPAQPCFIESLDPEAHKVTISPPPGLLEIYNA